MEKKLQTIQTYKQSANALAEKFNAIGARVSDIEETLAAIPKDNPAVLEIGCGNGRDAEEILKRTNNYVGLDISDELVALAREKNPKGNFVVADIEDYSFPTNIDAVVAFASLLHVPKESLKEVLTKARTALNSGGVVRLSMKYAPEYKESTVTDAFGTRTYYLYSEKDIEECAAGFKTLKSELNNSQGQVWLEVLLQKSQEQTV